MSRQEIEGCDTGQNLTIRMGDPVSFEDLCRAIAFGLTELKANERLLLLILVSCLSHGQLKAGECPVWINNRALCQRLGVGDRALRVIKRSLEEQGLVRRHYDERKPAVGSTVDLQPFLARLPELLERAEVFLEASGRRQ